MTVICVTTSSRILLLLAVEAGLCNITTKTVLLLTFRWAHTFLSQKREHNNIRPTINVCHCLSTCRFAFNQSAVFDLIDIVIESHKLSENGNLYVILLKNDD